METIGFYVLSFATLAIPALALVLAHRQDGIEVPVHGSPPHLPPHDPER